MREPSFVTQADGSKAPAPYARREDGDHGARKRARQVAAAADAAAAPLDLLLTDAAIGMLRRLNPGGSGLRLAAALAARPRLVAGRGANCWASLAASPPAPRRSSRRAGTAGSPTRDGQGNPLLRRAMQAYLAAAETAEGVVADAGLDTADAERHRLRR